MTALLPRTIGKAALAFAIAAFPALALVPPPSFEGCRLEVQMNLDDLQWCRCPTVDCTPFQGTCTYVFQTFNGVTWHACECDGQTGELCRGWARNVAWNEDEYMCVSNCPSTHECRKNTSVPTFPNWTVACECHEYPPV